MPTYKTPNVYVEEIPTLASSVAPVASAVPAFIGHTEKAGEANQYLNEPVRISSILDYKNIFGLANSTNFSVTLDTEDQISEITVTEDKPLPVTPKYLMYYTLRLFFENGGGACYIVSVGDYETELSKEAFDKGLTAISKEDEPTLLLLTDAVNLKNSRDYYELCKSALQQCNRLKDRFAIFDVLESKPSPTEPIGSSFRQGIGINNLKYGAAYYPYLQTSLNYYYTEESVALPEGASVGQYISDKGLKVTYNGPKSENPRILITTDLADGEKIAVTVENNVLTIKLPEAGATANDIVTASPKAEKYSLTASDDATGTVSELTETPLEYSATLNAIQDVKTELYNKIKTALNAKRVVMPPSGAVAGVYAKIDRERGVWKAPANVSLAAVIGPMEKITNEEQEDLNVDSISGKSINAIRSFTGKGTLIWGARTLAGNDNEWRYVPVRRLFNLIEESIQKATNFAVFESNNPITWLKVKTIISSYLDGLWRQGALAGASQEQAYFVNIGLGQTMTPQDILEGRMIIEIGIAAVRPAEFIVLRFSHKLQET